MYLNTVKLTVPKSMPEDTKSKIVRIIASRKEINMSQTYLPAFHKITFLVSKEKKHRERKWQKGRLMLS